MNYEKKYIEALERARKIHNQTEFDYEKGMMEEVFPELEENENDDEDEKIREGLIKYLKADMECNPSQCESFYNKSIAWLEKQKDTSKHLEATNEKQDNSAVQELIDDEEVRFPKFHEGYWIVSNDGRGHFSKFYEGDWIVSNDGRNIFFIKYISCWCCSLEDTNGIVHYPCLPPSESDFHHWTIQDAKDGDVLTYRVDDERVLIMIYEGLGKSFDGEVYAHALLDGDHFDESVGSVCCEFMKDLTPATKEQRDLLFQKMGESGYEWDAELKELRGLKKL